MAWYVPTATEWERLLERVTHPALRLGDDLRTVIECRWKSRSSAGIKTRRALLNSKPR
jgi:hypothetical protein